MKAEAWKKGSAILAIMTLAGSVAACGNNNNEGTVSPSAESSAGASPGATAAASESASPAEADSYKVTDEPLQLTIHYHQGDSMAFKDDFPVFKKAAELTNVTLKGTAPQTATSSNEVFNLMLASGDLPDIIDGSQINLTRAGMDGALVPLDDLIDENAPHLKQFLEENDWVKKGTVAADGKMYYIPFVMDGEAAVGWFIRKDWLDKLGLAYPTTVQEYHDVLKAFHDDDPNGNGKQDEVPFLSRNKRGAIELVALFGGRTTWYEKDGEAHYGRYEPEYQSAMANLAQWYKEGLIDKEIYTRGDQSREILFGDDRGGSLHDWFGSSASYNDSIKDKVPGFQLMPFAPPADTNGVVKEEFGRQLLQPLGWGISSSNKHPVETIKYFDFWFTDQGKLLGNLGIEGDTYTMVDGKAVYTDKVLKGADPVNKQMWDIGAQLYIGQQMDFQYESQWMNPIARDGSQMYIDGKYILPQFPTLNFNEEEQKVISQKWTAIDTYMLETEQKWVMGAEPVTDETFANYIKTLKSMGMDEVVAAYNSALKRYQSGN